MEGVTVRRQGIAILLVGLTFAGVSLGFLVAGLYCLLNGITLASSGKTTVGEIALGGLILTICLAAGASTILMWRYDRIIVSQAGLEHWNLLNRLTFKASWEELTQYQWVGDTNGSYCLVFAGQRKVNLGSDEAFVDEIRARAPQMVKLW